MSDILQRIVDHLAERVSGPLHFRLFLQPVVAATFAILDGRKDARTGGPAYLWTVFTDPARRPELLRDGWKSVGRVFLLAVIIDAVYQWMAVKFFYPGEALIVATILALVPYLLLRGPASWLFRTAKAGR
jgi:hypothetical protein